ncbi:MAG: PLDc N-terminal domain-containing protein, partial [Oscillospiraceae bacterium]|nr:PLDc N-terminal domain-containing protein [Oscillospiraceae bacterium]
MIHKKLMSYLFHRTAVIGLLMLLQLAMLGAMIKWFSDYFIYAYFFCVLLSIMEVLIIVNRQDDPGYKIAWIVPILLAPLFGGLFYLLCGGGQVTRQTKRKLADMDRHMKQTLGSDRKAQELAPFGQDAVLQARYLENIAYCPLYTNTYTKYFPLGDEVYEPLLEELRNAKNYIFLE